MGEASRLDTNRPASFVLWVIRTMNPSTAATDPSGSTDNWDPASPSCTRDLPRAAERALGTEPATDTRAAPCHGEGAEGGTASPHASLHTWERGGSPVPEAQLPRDPGSPLSDAACASGRALELMERSA